MKLFVTGGTGFVGCHFLDAAQAAGHRVRALRRPGSPGPRVPLKREPEWVDSVMENVTAGAFAGCDAVVHLAAHSANTPYDTLENCVHENVVVPLRLFRRAIEGGIDRFLVAGSCFEFGRAAERFDRIPADGPMEPTVSYPASKAAATAVFHALACECLLKMTFARIFQVYGEGESERRFWPSLRRAALAGEDMPMTSGRQVRDFIEVREVARQLVLEVARLEDVGPGQPRFVNIGTGHPQTLLEFAEHWWRKWQATGSLRPGAVPDRAGDVLRYVPDIAPHERHG